MQWVILITAIINTLLAVYTIVKIPRKYFIKNYFVIFSLITSIWLFSNVFVIATRSFAWQKIGYALGALMISSGCIVVESFSRQSKLKLGHFLLFYGIGLIYFTLSLVDNIFLRYNPSRVNRLEVTNLMVFYTLYFLAAIIYIIVRTMTSQRRLTGVLRKQATIIFIGILSFGILSFTVSFILPSFGYTALIDIDTAFSLLFVGFVAFAIFRYQLMDITVIVRKSSIYAVMIALVTAGYLLVIFAVENLFKGILGLNSVVPRVIASIVMAVVFLPIRNRVEIFIDKVFFRSNYEYAKALREFSEEVVKHLDLNTLVDLIVSNISRILKVQNIVLYLRNDCGKPMDCVASKGFTDGYLFCAIPDNIVEWIQDRKTVIIRDQLRDNADDHQEHILSCMDRMNSELLLPLIFNNELVGLLALGKKQSEELYSTEDLSLLAVFANETSIAVSNAKMLARTLQDEKMRQDYMIAGQIQKLFLPQSIDRSPGLDIAVHYSPAMEIGGDYYDVIRLDEYRSVIVLMDISGHGSSAAIVLSMLSSYFHANSGRFQSPGELANDLNREMIRRLKGQKYATGIILYWDDREQSASWTNAGHPEFLHLSRDGAILPVEKGTDPPVGIIEEQSFSSHKMSLSDRERIIMFTDGLYETMNSRGEMIGMEPVVECIAGLGDKPTGEMMEGLKMKIERFRGAAKQADDIAILVIRAESNDEIRDSI